MMEAPIVLPQPLTLQQKLQQLKEKYYISEPLTLINRIIDCESGGKSTIKHYNSNGTYDYSYFQINSTWKIYMNNLGLNYNDPDDSLEFGFILMSKNGLSDWNASRKCWST